MDGYQVTEEVVVQARHATRSRRSLLCAALAAVSLVALLLSACGSSSKPSYCSPAANLEKSVQNLSVANVLQNGTSGLKSALQKIESNARSVVSDAKSDFPKESSDVTSSLQALSNSLKQLSGTPSPATVAKIGQQVAASVTAIKNFANAAKSKCS